MKNRNLTNADNWVQEAKNVAELIFEGIDSWVRAGKLVEDILSKENAPTLEEFAGAAGISTDVVRRFEQIGRQELYPQLLARTSTGARKLAACSYREQKVYTENPVDVLVVKEEGIDSLKVDIDALTSDQCKQVFSKDHIRTNAEQRAWLESQEKREREKKDKEQAEVWEAPYRLHGKKVVFRQGAEISRRELIHILNELEG